MSEGLVRVWATSNAIDGELLKGRLEAEGIPVLLKGEGEGPYRAGSVYLWVPNEHEAAARAVIDAVQRGALEDDAFEDGAVAGELADDQPGG